MKRSNFIGSLSKIMGIPVPTLHYWEKEGLIHFNREGNKYRTFTLANIFELSDIAFYRDIAIPIEVLKKIKNMNLSDIDSILTSTELKLQQDIKRIESNLEQIHRRKAAILRIHQLRTQKVVKQCLPPLYDIVFEEYDAMQHRLNNPYKEAVFCLSSSPEKIWGATLDNIQNRQIVRPGDLEPRLYMNCLMMIEYLSEENLSTFKNNINELRGKAVELGYRPGDIMGTYLMSAYEGLHYTYYDCYVELLDPL